MEDITSPERIAALKEERQRHDKIVAQGHEALEELRALLSLVNDEYFGKYQPAVIRMRIEVEDRIREADDEELLQMEIAAGQAMNQCELVSKSIQSIKGVVDYYG